MEQRVYLIGAYSEEEE